MELDPSSRGFNQKPKKPDSGLVKHETPIPEGNDRKIRFSEWTQNFIFKKQLELR